MYKLIFFEIKRMLKSRKLIYFLVCIALALITNFILEKNLDQTTSSNLSFYNLFQTFNMFFFLICSFTLTTNITNDYEKNYYNFYHLLNISQKQIISIKILLNIFIALISIVPLMLIFGLSLSISWSIILKILGIICLSVILTIIIQSMVAILTKRNIKCITFCLLLWFVLTILNVIPIFHGLVCYFDNNSLVNYIIANILNITIASIITPETALFTSINYLYIYFIIVIGVVGIILVFLINSKKINSNK